MAASIVEASKRTVTWIVAGALVVATALFGTVPAHANGVDTASISGVIAADSGDAVDGVRVEAYLQEADTWSLIATASSDETGAYSVTGLAAGVYKLAFIGTAATPLVASEWWDDARTLSAAASLALDEGGTWTDVDPILATAGALTGAVTMDGGDTVSGAVVIAHPLDIAGFTDATWSATTDADGQFAFAALPGGDYAIEVTTAHASPTAAPEWWQDASDISSAAAVSVSPGETTENINPQLNAPGGLSGSLVDDTGAALVDFDVDVYASVDGEWDWYTSARTDADGAFSLVGLPGGDYRVAFGGFFGDDYARVYWQSAWELEEATTVTVPDVEVVHDLDAVLSAPISSTLPTVSGTVRVGSALTAVPGTWATGVTFAYQWYADDVEIAGATAAAFTPKAAHLGKKLSVKVTGSRAGTLPVSELSVQTVAVAAGVLTAPVPTLSGTASVGSTLTAKAGTWTSGAALTYKWMADGVAISGATGTSLVLAAAQQGKRITVAVTGALAGYTTKTSTSAATARVLLTARPSISGTSAVGFTYTALPGTWSAGTTFAYQWYANDVAISGATKSTFVITTAQAGKQVSVRVTGTLSGYPTVAVTSGKTAKIAIAGTPSIAGTVAFGSTLTAKPGTWTAGTKFAYQWYANGVAISGATKSTLVLGTAQKDKQISLRVTGSLSGYATVAKSTGKTAKVITAATPTIAGTVRVGRVLTAKPGAWTSRTTFSYQWYANGASISGATKATYTLKSAQKGKTITVKVTGKKSGYATVAKTSKATGKVQ